MKLKIKSSLSPAIVRGKHNDTIVAGTIYEVNGQPWKHTYLQLRGHIAFKDIEWIQREPELNYTEKTVYSTKSNEKYIVRTYKDGRKTCTCYGFMYRKQCKHTKV